MEAQHFPDTRDLRADLPVTSRVPPRAQRKYFWIDEDPDLTPPKAARRETPLSAWS